MSLKRLKSRAQSNVYISMTISEGVSASLMEAMASGCYPVVSDLTANRMWIRDGQSGELVKTDDLELLVQRLREVWEKRDTLAAAIEENRCLIEEKGSQETNIRTFAQRYKNLQRFKADRQFGLDQRPATSARPRRCGVGNEW